MAEPANQNDDSGPQEPRNILGDSSSEPKQEAVSASDQMTNQNQDKAKPQEHTSIEPTHEATSTSGQTTDQNQDADNVQTEQQSPRKTSKPTYVPSLSAKEQDWKERREADNRREGRDPDTGNDSTRKYHPDTQGIGHQQAWGSSIELGNAARDEYPRGGTRPKNDYSSLPESNDPGEIRKQVEFYFSDSNVIGDNFLLTQTGGPKNLPVAVKEIHNFGRMRRFRSYSAVVEALRESTLLTITGDVGDERIQRKIPIDEAYSANNLERNLEIYETKARPRSIYAKGFGRGYKTIQLDIEEFFEPYGPIGAVRLRRYGKLNHFKGSVFVEFDSVEIQQQFLALDPKPKWEKDGVDVELEIMSKEDYLQQKAEEVRTGQSSGDNRENIDDNRSDSRNNGRHGDRYNDRHNSGHHGDRNARDGRDSGRHHDRRDDRNSGRRHDRRADHHDDRGNDRRHDRRDDKRYGKKRERGPDATEQEPEAKKTKADEAVGKDE